MIASSSSRSPAAARAGREVEAGLARTRSIVQGLTSCQAVHVSRVTREFRLPGAAAQRDASPTAPVRARTSSRCDRAHSARNARTFSGQSRTMSGLEHVRRIEMAGHELVADSGPGGVSHEFNLDAPRSSEMLGFRHVELGQRHISNAEPLCHRNSSAAVMMERATSAIFLFSLSRHGA